MISTFSHFFKVSLVSSAILLSLTSPSSGQAQPNQPPNQQTPCTSRFEAAVAPECFTASGINFTGVLFVISGNRSGALPSGQTYEGFLKLLCDPASRDKVIPCVLDTMNKNNGSQCSPADQSQLFSRGGQLLAFLDAVCTQPCEQEALQSLYQCFSVTRMHPERLMNQNASITEDRYSILGRNETEIEDFCKNREKLFSCLSPLSVTCPGYLQRMYNIGIDLQALETATGFLCNDRTKYLQSLDCFSKPSPERGQCTQAAVASLRVAFLGRYQTGSITPSKYQDSLCKARITQVGCEMKSFEKTCDKDSTALRASVDCTLLPKPCREATQAEYNGLCQQVTTPSPAQTIRPTQGKPEVVANAGAGNLGGVQSGVQSGRTNQATSSSQVGIRLLLISCILSFVSSSCLPR